MRKESLIDRVRKSSLARNAAALYGAHIGGLIFPLIAIPYLARVLRPDGWGVVVFAQAFAAVLTLLVEYGFYLSATREISQRRDDREHVARVVANVQSAKCILLFVVTALSMGAYLAIPLFRDHPQHLFWAWCLAASQGISAYWYFQGMERMGAPALTEAASKGIATGLLFLLIRGPGDGPLVLAIYAATAFGWAAITNYWVYREVAFRRLRFGAGLQMLRSTYRLFAFRASAGFMATSNSFVLGALAGPQVVAFFGGAERVIRGATNLIHPATQAIYPRMSHVMKSDKPYAARLLGRSLLLVLGIGFGIALVAEMAAPQLVALLLGPGYEEAIPVLRMLAVLPPIVAVSTVLGLQWALPTGLDRPYLYIMIAAAVVNVGLAVVLVPRFGTMGMAGAVISAECFVAASLVVLASRYGRDLWREALGGLVGGKAGSRKGAPVTEQALSPSSYRG